MLSMGKWADLLFLLQLPLLLLLSQRLQQTLPLVVRVMRVLLAPLLRLLRPPLHLKLQELMLGGEPVLILYTILWGKERRLLLAGAPWLRGILR